MEARSPKIVIVAGGTGGHLFPGIAVAEALRELGLASEIRFLITGKEFESKALEDRGIDYLVIKSTGLKGLGFLNQLWSLITLSFSIIRLYLYFRSIRPDVLLCMGAHISGPAGVAAKLMGIKLAIHEQNTYPGLTNRLLFRIADKAFVSFEETIDYLQNEKYSKSSKILLTGNPIRSSMRNKKITPWEEREECLLILGGSQGAKFLNDTVIQALNLLKERRPLPSIIHLTGPAHFQEVKAQYEALNIPAEVYPFREDMEEVLNRATLAISRAGAGAIFELSYFGIPSVLIPYPFAANRHQHTNALVVCKNNGGIFLDQRDLTPEELSSLLESLLADRKRLGAISQAARAFSKPDAAYVIAKELVGLVKD